MSMLYDYRPTRNRAGCFVALVMPRGLYPYRLGVPRSREWRGIGPLFHSDQNWSNFPLL